MTPEELRAYVTVHVRHDRDWQPDTYDPEEILKIGVGRCGHRAAVFQYLAMKEGVESRVIMYRGHVANQIKRDGVWVDWDCTVPENKYHKEMLDHIKVGPVYALSYHSDYRNHAEYQRWNPGEYTYWLGGLQDTNPNILLPRDLLHGVQLAPDRVNVIIRHDICHYTPESRRAWMGMVHEEQQLGLKSVSYVPVESLESVELFRMFEHEGFEFGLHSKAIRHHDEQLKEVLGFLKSEWEYAKGSLLRMETVQSHGYDDSQGDPTLTHYMVDRELPHSFRCLVDMHPEYAGRIADSIAVMSPRAIGNLQPGKLYYCLWHPEWYTVENGWVKYLGLYQAENSLEHLEANLKPLNKLIKDTGYFDTAQHYHLQTVAEWIRKNVQGTVLDLAAGWALLGLFIPNPYMAVDNEYKRMKAAQSLYQSLSLQLPSFLCRDIRTDTNLPDADCVVLIGWEGDLDAKPDFTNICRHAKTFLIVSYITHKTDAHYTLISREEMQTELERNGFLVEQRLLYHDGFPREIAIARRKQ